jgi:hypothetical protein
VQIAEQNSGQPSATSLEIFTTTLDKTVGEMICS